jgi:hypothetical protein
VLLSCLDPDGPPPDDELTASTPPRGELWLRQRRDGRLGVEGWLDPEHGSLVRALIEQLAARRPDHDGEPDTRTVPIGIRCALVARDGGCSFPATDRPGCAKPTTRVTGSTVARLRCRIAAYCARPTINKSTSKAGTSPSAADASNSGLPRSSTLPVDP